MNTGIDETNLFVISNYCYASLFVLWLKESNVEVHACEEAIYFVGLFNKLFHVLNSGDFKACDKILFYIRY